MSRHRRQASQALPANLDVTEDVPTSGATSTHEFTGLTNQAHNSKVGVVAKDVTPKTEMGTPEALPRRPTTLDSKKKASASDL